MIEEKIAYITLDLENDWYVEGGDQYRTLEYVDEFIELIDRVDVPVTLFTVGKLFEERPDDVEKLEEGLQSEFHLHSYAHDPEMKDGFRTDLLKGMDAYASFFGEEPVGYRAPLGKIAPGMLRTLEREGFTFDSSVFPSYRPGAYNNLSAPTNPYSPEATDELVEFPVSVCPRIRIPLSQSYLKLLGRPYRWYVKSIPLPDQLVFVSHLHDFFDTPAFARRGQPTRAIQQRNIADSKRIFVDFIDHLKESGYAFDTLSGENARVSEGPDGVAASLDSHSSAKRRTESGGTELDAR